jgi:hypothetical protein
MLQTLQRLQVRDVRGWLVVCSVVAVLTTLLGVSAVQRAAAVNPLTGLPMRDADAILRRPLVVKISNSPPLVRPQAGIGEADLVFEHVAEGDVTRFTAVFWSHAPERIGSVRSARLIDLDLVPMLGGLLAYSGASDGVQAAIKASDFAARAFLGVAVGDPIFYRDPAGQAPHNLFLNPAELSLLADLRGVNTADAGAQRGFRFGPMPAYQAGASHPGTTITIDYGPTVAEWRYDPARGRYARWTEDGAGGLAPHADANTGEQVSTPNVILLYARHTHDRNIPETEWQGVKYYAIRVNLRDHGPATICREGRCISGQWVRSAASDLFSFRTIHDQQPLLLAAGTTWFQVVNLPGLPDHQQQITIR